MSDCPLILYILIEPYISKIVSVAAQLFLIRNRRRKKKWKVGEKGSKKGDQEVKRRWRQGEWLANTTYWKGTTCSLPWGDGSPAHSWRMKMLYQPALYIWKITFALRIYTYIITFQFCVYHHSFSVHHHPWVSSTIAFCLRTSSPFSCVYHHLFNTSSPFLRIPSHIVYENHWRSVPVCTWRILGLI